MFSEKCYSRLSMAATSLYKAAHSFRALPSALPWVVGLVDDQRRPSPACLEEAGTMSLCPKGGEEAGAGLGLVGRLGGRAPLPL